MSADKLARSCSCNLALQILTFCVIQSVTALCSGFAQTCAAEEYRPATPVNVSGFDCPGTADLTDPISLEYAVDMALCNNAHVRAAWESIRMQAAAVGAAESAYLPTLSVTVSELNDRTGYPGSEIPAATSTGRVTYGSFDWRLFDFGRRSSALHSARSLLEVATQTRDAVLQKTLSSVVDAYFSAASARADLKERIEDEALAQDIMASAQRRFAAGGGSQNDVLQATASLAKSKLDESSSTGAYQKAKAMLGYVTGIPVGTHFELPEDIDARTGLEAKELAQWLQEAQRNHPSVLAAQASVEAARQRVSSARSSGLPYVDLTANYYQNGFPNQGLAGTNSRVTTVGVSITIPLFDGLLTLHNIEAAKAEERIDEAQLQDTRESISMAVIQSYADAESSLRNLEYSETLLNAARAAFDSSQRRYVQGAADIIEVLNAKSVLSTAESERIHCIAQWRTARLDLLSSAGALNRSDVKN